MVRLSDLRWRELRARLAHGDVLTSAELADLLQAFGRDGIPDDIRAVLVERLRKAPTPGKGRPRQTAEGERKRTAWVLSIYNRVNQHWARGGKKAEAIAKTAAEYDRSVEYIRDILKNHAPKARRECPTLAFSRTQWREWESKKPEEIQEKTPRLP
jgi:hypothetical protein